MYVPTVRKLSFSPLRVSKNTQQTLLVTASAQSDFHDEIQLHATAEMSAY